jgi:very-short-patch-repair endonuclease
MTDAEICLWRRLREQRLRNYKFRRQQPIGRYVVDFVCLQNRLVIELDGGQHVESKEVDTARTQWLESQGFRVLRFWNDDVLCKTDTVMRAIWSALQTESD